VLREPALLSEVTNAVSKKENCRLARENIIACPPTRSKDRPYVCPSLPISIVEALVPQIASLSSLEARKATFLLALI
jgi:hypothetical protein